MTQCNISKEFKKFVYIRLTMYLYIIKLDLDLDLWFSNLFYGMLFLQKFGTVPLIYLWKGQSIHRTDSTKFNLDLSTFNFWLKGHHCEASLNKKFINFHYKNGEILSGFQMNILLVTHVFHLIDSYLNPSFSFKRFFWTFLI